MMPGSQICIVTSTDDHYVAGTCVLLASVLRQNPWFAGDIVVLHTSLSGDSRRRLAAFPRIQFRQASSRIAGRLDNLVAAQPRFAPKSAILLSLEAFGLAEYARVLKLDSDILCTGDLAPLFATDAGLCACPDRFYYMNMRRDSRTYVPLPSEAWTDATLPVTFNPGVMMIAPDRLPPSTYEDLLTLLQPSTFDGVLTGHSDSVILNHHFRGAWRQVSERFNYFVWRDEARYPRPRVPFDEAVLLHFLPKPKPWETSERGQGPAHRDRALALWDAAAARLTTRDTD